MRMTPRINPEGKVSMRVEPIVSVANPKSVDPGYGYSPPTINVQAVQSTMVASDGQTVVLRGPSVPSLWLNPNDGALVTLAKRAFESKKGELLFILTPHIVKATAGDAGR
jgi:type II secretory pathway component GspD/PulD (secretin)